MVDIALPWRVLKKICDLGAVVGKKKVFFWFGSSSFSIHFQPIPRNYLSQVLRFLPAITVSVFAGGQGYGSFLKGNRLFSGGFD